MLRVEGIGTVNEFALPFNIQCNINTTVQSIAIFTPRSAALIASTLKLFSKHLRIICLNLINI